MEFLQVFYDLKVMFITLTILQGLDLTVLVFIFLYSFAKRKE